MTAWGSIFRALLIGSAVTSFTLVIQKPAPQWEDTFRPNKAVLASTGRNDYFILEPGRRLELAGGDTRLVVTVLNATERVDGVTTRVVEEREWENGKLIEVSRNFFAIDQKPGDVYYFGEDVDMYRDGKVVSHEGAWRSGAKGAKFGLMMPGKPAVGRAFYQEIAPKVAMDRAKVVSLSQRVKTPEGTFNDCLKIEETTPLEPGVKEYKYYASGVGLIQDADLKLVKRG